MTAIEAAQGRLGEHAQVLESGAAQGSLEVVEQRAADALATPGREHAEAGAVGRGRARLGAGEGVTDEPVTWPKGQEGTIEGDGLAVQLAGEPVRWSWSTGEAGLDERLEIFAGDLRRGRKTDARGHGAA